MGAAYDLRHSPICDYKSFQQMADNDDINIVYIALPNSLHVPYTTAGKHASCKKRMAIKPITSKWKWTPARSASRATRQRRFPMKGIGRTARHRNDLPIRPARKPIKLVALRQPQKKIR